MDSKGKWKDGLPNELEHWRHWLASGRDGAFAGGRFDDYEWRTNPNTVLQAHIARHLEPFAPPGTTISILDVGAGPLTCVGKKWPERIVHIVAVDPLAEQYNQLLKQLNIAPLVRVQFAEVERLSEHFPLNHFDLVNCQNALDHVYDPFVGIQQMLAVVKPQHAVVLLHRVNEGEREGYYGLHQWNFSREGDEFTIWNKDLHLSVNEALTPIADVHFHEAWESDLLVVSLIKKEEATEAIFAHSKSSPDLWILSASPPQRSIAWYAKRLFGLWTRR